MSCFNRDSEVEVKFCCEEGLEPNKAHPEDSGFDIKSCEDVVIRAGEISAVRTGLTVVIPAGYEGQVRGRSGLAFRNWVQVFNSPGTIDAGYRGEVGVLLHNAGINDYHVSRGDRIAQLVIAPVVKVNACYAVSDVVVEGVGGRGVNGFGSTGK